MSAVWIACTLSLLAHNPDTSYIRVQIAADQVQTRLTLDVFTLRKIARLDDNDDGELQRAELARHAPEIYSFLREHIWLTIDTAQSEDLGERAGFVWPADTGESIREADFHTANGLIHFDLVRPVEEMPEEVTLTFGVFDKLGSQHSILGVFAVSGNEYEVTFGKYEPDFTYETGVQPVLAHRLWRFFKMGVKHIFVGYDHICFLIALIVVSKFREVVKIVTSFTIAHSLTLIMAALDVVHLPTRLVETCIAATIVYVAVENLWVKSTRHRWWLTFFFGLVHGFGFANVLREMGLPTTGLVRCLISFNVGVEFGQLVIATALLPVAWILARWKYGRIAVITISCLLAAFGLAWFIDRAFALEFMPF
jgi:hydrogenase/urease accessory protein HupE